MYLSNIISSFYSDPIYKKSTSDYLFYFQEMHQFTNAYLDQAMLKKKSGYAFSELFHHAVNENEAIFSLLQKTEVCILMNASYEYDSHYSHVGTYLRDYYKLDADLFDISEQGSFGLIAVFHFLSAYFSRLKKTRGLIIGFEQRALPLRVNQIQQLPPYNGIGLIDLFFDNSARYGLLKVVEADNFSEKNVAEKLRALEKNNSVRSYLLSSRSHLIIPDFLSRYQVSLVSIHEGILPLFLFLDQLQKSALCCVESVIHVVFIEDLVLREWGMIVLEAEGVIGKRNKVNEYEFP